MLLLKKSVIKRYIIKLRVYSKVLKIITRMNSVTTLINKNITF